MIMGPGLLTRRKITLEAKTSFSLDIAIKMFSSNMKYKYEKYQVIAEVFLVLVRLVAVEVGAGGQLAVVCRPPGGGGFGNLTGIMTTRLTTTR